MTHRIIALILLGASSTAWAGESASMRKNCRLEHPSNPYWKQACYEHHRASQRELVRLRRNGKAKIVNRCISENPGAAAGTDWSSALSCARYYLKEERRK